MKGSDPALLISCEHGGNGIPAAWRDLFSDAGEVLASHRGYDIGALAVAKILSRRLTVPLIASTTSRLLVDLNRSLHHPRLYSDYTRGLDPVSRTRILDACYHPYRDEVETALTQRMDQAGKVLHLSIHSFTPILDGKLRQADIGLLYDPARPRERQHARRLRQALAERTPLRVRMNYPYRGTADGLTTACRKRYPAKRYLGMEIEINQAQLTNDAGIRAIANALGSAIAAVR